MTTAVFAEIVMFSKIAPKVTRYLGYFCKKICDLKLLIIAQSCHTGSFFMPQIISCIMKFLIEGFYPLLFWQWLKDPYETTALHFAVSVNYLIKHLTIVIYNSRVVLTTNLLILRL